MTTTQPTDAVSPAALNALSDEALRQVIAHASGILAHRAGEYPVACTLDNVRGALLRAPGGPA